MLRRPRRGNAIFTLLGTTITDHFRCCEREKLKSFMRITENCNTIFGRKVVKNRKSPKDVRRVHTVSYRWTRALCIWPADTTPKPKTRTTTAPNEIISLLRVFHSHPQCPTSWIIQPLSPGGIRWMGEISDTRTMVLTRSDCGVSEAGEPCRHLTPISPRLSNRCIEFADRKLYFTRVPFLRVPRINRGPHSKFQFPRQATTIRPHLLHYLHQKPQIRTTRSMLLNNGSR